MVEQTVTVRTLSEIREVESLIITKHFRRITEYGTKIYDQDLPKDYLKYIPNTVKKLTFNFITAIGFDLKIPESVEELRLLHCYRRKGNLVCPNNLKYIHFNVSTFRWIIFNDCLEKLVLDKVPGISDDEIKTISKSLKIFHATNCESLFDEGFIQLPLGIEELLLDNVFATSKFIKFVNKKMKKLKKISVNKCFIHYTYFKKVFGTIDVTFNKKKLDKELYKKLDREALLSDIEEDFKEKNKLNIDFIDHNTYCSDSEPDYYNSNNRDSFWEPNHWEENYVRSMDEWHNGD